MKETLHLSCRGVNHPSRDSRVPTWDIEYHLNLETPANNLSEDNGWPSVDPVEKVVQNIDTFEEAARVAKRWAIGSGYKPSAPRILYGNTFEIRLRRP